MSFIPPIDAKAVIESVLSKKCKYLDKYAMSVQELQNVNVALDKLSKKF